MGEHVVAAWRTLVPARGEPHGPLPPLLIVLTVVTGLVDAFSYLELGHVFVANMTGNVVFLSFALGGAAGFVWWASILAAATFMVGAFLGGRLASSRDGHRGRLFAGAVVVQTVLVAVSAIVAFAVPRPYETVALAALVVLLGVAMGLQNAVARHLAVPDLTTTVLTMTIAGVAADSRPAGGSGSRLGRRVVSIASMFVGGLLGAWLCVSGHAPIVLVVAAVLLAGAGIAGLRVARSTDPWTRKA